MGTQGQVRFRGCECPGTPHDGLDGADDGDVVYLRPHLGFAAGAEAARMYGEAIVIVSETGADENGRLVPGGTHPVIDATHIPEMVGPVYLRGGIMGWNLTDALGLPVPLDISVIEDNFEYASYVWDEAEEMYGEAVVAPLVRRMNALSQPGPTVGSTHRSQRSSAKHRSQPKRSSQRGSAGRRSATSP